jgi:hypothetical protein
VENKIYFVANDEVCDFLPTFLYFWSNLVEIKNSNRNIPLSLMILQELGSVLEIAVFHNKTATKYDVELKIHKHILSGFFPCLLPVS